MVQDGQVRCQQRLEPAWREGGHLRSLGDPCSEPRASFFAGPAAFLGLPRSTSRRRSSSAVLIRRCVAPAFLAARAWRVCQFSERAKPTGYAARVDSRSWSRRPLADAAPPVRARRSDRARRTTARRASPRGAAAVGTRRAIFFVTGRPRSVVGGCSVSWRRIGIVSVFYARPVTHIYLCADHL